MNHDDVVVTGDVENVKLPLYEPGRTIVIRNDTGHPITVSGHSGWKITKTETGFVCEPKPQEDLQ